MREKTKIAKPQGEKNYVRRSVQNAQPLRIMLLVTLFGIAALFTGLFWLFWVSAEEAMATLSLPHFFVFSAIVLALSSASIFLAQHAFAREQRRWHRWTLFLAGILGVVFLVSQLIGWRTWRTSGLEFAQNSANAYLYLATALQHLHVIIGLVLLATYGHSAFRKTAHPGTALFYFTDPVKRLYLRLIAIYWHFVVAIWLILMALLLWLIH